jgi:outer membrane protein TolC
LRKVAAIACLWTFPLSAQQANTALTLQPSSTGAQQSQPGQAPLPNAPQVKELPQPTHVDYSKPAPLLPNPFARYIPRDVPPPAFTNAPKIEQLIQNGKLMLSLNDAISIALADNLDIAVARYNLPIADTDILRTKAGGSFLGVNSGVVSNTPGGGQGGIGAGISGAGAGGTTAGAGGAGVGAGGFVGSTSGAGPQPDSFDPIITGTFSLEQSATPTNFGLLAGLGASGATTIPTSTAHTTTGDLTYFQGFSPGTALTVTFNNQRQTTNGVSQSFNPVLTSNFRASVRQHLLQGFGRNLNLRLLRTARNNKKIAEEGFREQVISTVSQIENIYWDLVNAYEAYRVNERSLALAQKTLSDNQKQVQIGTLAPLDVVRAQSSVATAEQALIASRTNLQLQQLVIKNALTRSLPSNSGLVQAEVIPTDTVEIPEQENLPPVEQLIQMAFANRPDYKQQRITLQNNEINIKGVNNGLLPVVDLVAFYGGSGLAGVQNPLGTCPAGNPATCTPPGTLPPTGFTNAFGNLFNSTGPDKGVAVNIQIPLGNRVAQATQVRALLEYRQSQLSLKTVENTITIGIRNDVFTLENNRASVVAAQKARDLAAQTLDAEQKKYNLGASTYLAVLQDERDLAQAESALVSAQTNYAKARVQLDRDTAQTLDRYNIKIDEAVTGDIKTQPNVPGIMPNKSALQDTNAPAMQQQPGAQQPTQQQPPAQQPPAQQPPTQQPPR